MMVGTKLRFHRRLRQLRRGQRRQRDLQRDGRVLYRLLDLHGPELGRGEKGPDDEELLHQPRLFVRDRGGAGRSVSSVRRASGFYAKLYESQFAKA